MGLLVKKLKAASLIEPIVAMIILIVVIGLASLTYLNSIKKSDFYFFALSKSIESEEISKIRTSKIYVNESFDKQGLHVEKIFYTFPGSEKTMGVKIKISNQEFRVVSTHNYLIKTTD